MLEKSIFSVQEAMFEAGLKGSDLWRYKFMFSFDFIKNCVCGQTWGCRSLGPRR